MCRAPVEVTERQKMLDFADNRQLKRTRGIDPEIAALDRLEAVSMALKVLRRSTGLRIALVAKVTADSWTACAVLDEANFGILPGDQLELSSTF